MSTEALDILDQHRENQLEISPFSEEFSFGGGTFRGIFDEDHSDQYSSKSTGHLSQRKLSPRILIAKPIDGMTARETKITRVRTGSEFTLLFTAIDREGVSVLWLY